ncbi:MAG TPA: hypothetical protein VGW39_15110 [Chthoniobacterales bacterium]|nr:hypothetical protein [Chthoniobacterales bacterium]
MTLPRLSDAQRARIRSIEWIVAALFAALIVVLHFVNLKHAGGLWRDEAAAVNLALFPSFGEISSNLEHESFPLLLTMLLRAWNALGLGGSDLTLRIFGMLVGLAVLAALWWNARRFSASPPIISMLLFGLSPVAIRWGDSLRAYGLGVFFLLLALGLIWNVVRSPSRKTVLLAMVASIFAVQTLYQSIFMLAVFCLGGVVVAARRRDFKRALLVLSVALPAALSLLPYLGVIRRASQWNVATEVSIDLPRIWLVLHRALSDPGPLMFWLWVLLFSAAIVTGCLLLPRKKQAPVRGDDSEVAWFLLTIMLGTTIAYYIFLKLLKFPTETWYYLVWMGVVAVAIDALVARMVRDGWARAIRLFAVVVAVAALSRGVWQQAGVRMTNLDLVAQRLNKDVGKEDFVLVHPWFCGVTFQRYYSGSAEWTSLPPLADYRLQRLDLFKEQMQLEAPIQPVLEKMEATLRAGHVVWLVGYYPFSNPPRPAPKLPRAGEGPEGWRGAPYMMAYGMEVAYFIQAHALEGASLKPSSSQAVNPFENLPVRAVSGWRSSRF